VKKIKKYKVVYKYIHSFVCFGNLGSEMIYECSRMMNIFFKINSHNKNQGVKVRGPSNDDVVRAFLLTTIIKWT
jgi:hypothetical protein